MQNTRPMASRVDIQQSFQQSSASHNPHHFNTYAGQGSRRSRGNIDVFTSQDDRGKPDTVLHNLIGLDDDNETWDITIVDRKSSRVAKVSRRFTIRCNHSVLISTFSPNAAHSGRRCLRLDGDVLSDTNAHRCTNPRSRPACEYTFRHGGSSLHLFMRTYPS